MHPGVACRAMPRPTNAQARRRRLGAATVLALLAATVLLLLRPQGPAPAAHGTTTPAASTTTTGPSAPATADPSADAVPAWLGWMPGGFPEGFRQQVAQLPDLTDTVVVAGDTRWLTASHDAGGAVVDEPDPPYGIPIDAFAVDPPEYAPFLPEALRDQILAALKQGQAVLGESSAALRRIGAGGTMTFGDQTVTVGAVAPDAVVGWSELLVNREVGAKLGISVDRYLLALGDGSTLSGFEAGVRSLLAADTYLRVVKPGGTDYVRVASGVNPPVVMKQVFGEFAAYPRSDDPAYLNMDPAWYETHIETRTVPLLGQVTCNAAFLPALESALQQVLDEGLGGGIHVYSGCYAARTVARSDTAPPSEHAYGAAIDINAPENAYDATPTMDPRIVKIFESWGFLWGGDFLIPDGMHFEYGSPSKGDL